MQISRKAAILSLLMAIIGGEKAFSQQADPPALQDDKDAEEPEPNDTPKALFTVGMNSGLGDLYMLEVRADGRVARFTAKEVMDALGGEWDRDKP